MADKIKIVVIGNGMSGLCAIEAILKTKADVAITIFGDEPYPNYNRIMLSDILARKTSYEKIILNSDAWYQENYIDLRKNEAIAAIDPQRKVVISTKGDESPYDYLIIAVGALPFIPHMIGADKKQVMVFRTLDETQQIIELAQSDKAERPLRDAVVIGGGLLGLEAARGLMNHGVSSTVIHLMDRLMEQQLDPMGGWLLKREISRMGIPVLLNTTATEILGNDDVEGVRIASGEVYPCDMVLICAGVRPNIALAKVAGLRVNRGVIVNDQMETSVSGIFALGDVIEHRDRTYGLVAPLRDQAAALADAIVGGGTRRYEGTLCATTLKVAGINLTSAGDIVGDSLSEALSFLDTEKGIYKKCVIRKNRLTGFILVGDNQDATRLFNILSKGEELSAIKGTLLGALSIGDNKSGGATGATGMDDSDIICNCNNVTKGTILEAIKEKGLKTREQVGACTLASTGCGSCAQLVDDLLAGPTKAAAIAAVQSTGTDRPTGQRVLRGGLNPAGGRAADVEKVKQEGLGLDFYRLKEVGAKDLSIEDQYRLKTYGFCAQKHPGYFMLRQRIPGGLLTSMQIKRLVEVCETYGRDAAHITTRQSLELHWVRVEDALDIFEKLSEVGITTRSTCGDTLRNVSACPHGGIAEDGLVDVQPYARQISDYYVEHSALINPTMPNRMNTYFAACRECNPDALLNDIGFVAVARDFHGKREIGFEVWVGGSLGTHPFLGFKIRDFIPLSDALPVCLTIFEMHTKFGDRIKTRSRLKYLIEKWGREKFVVMFDKLFLEKKSLPEVRQRAEARTTAPQSIPTPVGRGQYANTVTQEDSTQPGWLKRFFASVMPTVSIPTGAIKQRQRGFSRLVIDVPLGEIRARQIEMVGKIAKRYGNDHVYFTKEQNIELHWIRTGKVGSVIKQLKKVELSPKVHGDSLKVLACPGTEFCSQAVTNALGTGRDILKNFKSDSIEKMALSKSLSIHIAGCQNGCTRHQVADIGFVGELVTVGEMRSYLYQLFLGGCNGDGDRDTNKGVRIGEMVRKGITDEMIIPTVNAILELVLEQRQAGETFQEVIDRLTPEVVSALLEPRLLACESSAPEEIHMEVLS
ncbi:MAG: FAD-dependent oxidoreductase [Nitrospirota bacterium]